MKRYSSAVSLFALLPIMLLAGCGPASGGKREGDTIVIQGSDTEVQLVSTLVEAFAADHPDANISVAGGGSAVGIAALLNGTTDIANSSRALKPEEMTIAKEKNLDVQEFVLARDGLSIIVHPKNPVVALSLEQLGKIFSGVTTNWKDVGGSDAPIVLYGRQSTSGTFGFFRDIVVKGDYAATMRQMEGSQAIVEAVEADENAIGYTGIGYVKNSDGTAKQELRIVPVSSAGGAALSPLNREAVLSGKYPIARRIYQYLPAPPKQGSPMEEFLRFEASDKGQEIIEESGFYAVSPEDAVQNASILERIQ